MSDELYTHGPHGPKGPLRHIYDNGILMPLSIGRKYRQDELNLLTNDPIEQNIIYYLALGELAAAVEQMVNYLESAAIQLHAFLPDDNGNLLFTSVLNNPVVERVVKEIQQIHGADAAGLSYYLLQGVEYQTDKIIPLLQYWLNLFYHNVMAGQNGLPQQIGGLYPDRGAILITAAPDGQSTVITISPILPDGAVPEGAGPGQPNTVYNTRKRAVICHSTPQHGSVFTRQEPQVPFILVGFESAS